MGGKALPFVGTAVEAAMAYNAPTSQSADMNNPNAEALSNRNPMANAVSAALGGGSTTMGDVNAQ